MEFTKRGLFRNADLKKNSEIQIIQQQKYPAFWNPRWHP